MWKERSLEGEYERIDVHVIVDGYSQFVSQRIDEGWAAYLLTIHFKEMGGSIQSKVRMMIPEVHRMYATMLTRLVRTPRRASAEELPIWLALPDFPVPKYAKQPLRTITVNDGLHWHAICLVPENVRIKQCLASHVERF